MLSMNCVSCFIETVSYSNTAIYLHMLVTYDIMRGGTCFISLINLDKETRFEKLYDGMKGFTQLHANLLVAKA